MKTSVRTPLLYVLDASGFPVAEPDAAAWRNWFATADDADVIVGDDTVCDGVTVTTVFTGVARFECPRPRVYVTRIEGGVWDGLSMDSPSRESALKAHYWALGEVLRPAPMLQQVIAAAHRFPAQISEQFQHPAVRRPVGQLGGGVLTFEGVGSLGAGAGLGAALLLFLALACFLWAEGEVQS